METEEGEVIVLGFKRPIIAHGHLRTKERGRERERETTVY